MERAVKKKTISFDVATGHLYSKLTRRDTDKTANKETRSFEAFSQH